MPSLPSPCAVAGGFMPSLPKPVKGSTTYSHLHAESLFLRKMRFFHNLRFVVIPSKEGIQIFFFQIVNINTCDKIFSIIFKKYKYGIFSFTTWIIILSGNDIFLIHILSLVSRFRPYKSGQAGMKE
jgi:hypothetical protein